MRLCLADVHEHLAEHLALLELLGEHLLQKLYAMLQHVVEADRWIVEFLVIIMGIPLALA